MGARGPKPKPPALKLLAGNPGKRPAPAGVARPRVKAGRPDRPPELDGEAAAEWDRIVPELDAAGMLATIDRAALATYCLAWAELIVAKAILDEEGRTVREPIQSAKGEQIGERVKLHPAVKLQQNAFTRVRALLDGFGLTPQARQRFGGGDDGAATPVNAVVSIRDRIQAARGEGGA